MQAEGTLIVFAELFVAFAGFTGLAGIIRHTDEDGTVLGEAIRMLLEYSLIFLVLSVLPLVLFQGGLSESASWRVAAIVSAVQTVVYYTLRGREVRAAADRGGSSTEFRIIAGTDWLFAAALVLAAAELIPVAAASIYLANLFWNLIGTALSFVRLLRPIWLSPEGSGGS